jgi:hypothetical protein
MVLHNTNIRVPCIIAPDIITTGLYVATCLPETAGTYVLHLNQEPSIYTPLIAPNVADAAHSQIQMSTVLHPILEQRYFNVKLLDTFGNALRAGGDHLRVVLTGAALVVADVVDDLNGTYTVSYSLPKRGLYETQVWLMKPRLHGLMGSFYATASDRKAEVTEITPFMHLETISYPKVEWNGYLLGPFTELFQLQLVGGTLFIDHVEIPFNGTIMLFENHLHTVHIQYKKKGTSMDVVDFSWLSARTQLSNVPSNHLFPIATEIALSRYRLTGV